MEKNERRIDEIKQKLTQALQPTTLEVNDESHLHVGHEGAKTGLGHFSVSITSPAFTNKSPIETHRMIYEALGTMMSTDIHALRIINASAE